MGCDMVMSLLLAVPTEVTGFHVCFLKARQIILDVGRRLRGNSFIISLIGCCRPLVAW
jgi:hypothetical protein